MSSRLEDALGGGTWLTLPLGVLGVADAPELAGVVAAVIVVERLPVGVVFSDVGVVTETGVVTVVTAVVPDGVSVGVVEGVPDGVDDRLVGGRLVIGVVGVTEVDVELLLLFSAAATATVGRRSRVVARILKRFGTAGAQ